MGRRGPQSIEASAGIEASLETAALPTEARVRAAPAAPAAPAVASASASTATALTAALTTALTTATALATPLAADVGRARQAEADLGGSEAGVAESVPRAAAAVRRCAIGADERR